MAGTVFIDASSTAPWHFAKSDEQLICLLSLLQSPLPVKAQDPEPGNLCWPDRDSKLISGTSTRKERDWKQLGGSRPKPGV